MWHQLLDGRARMGPVAVLGCLAVTSCAGAAAPKAAEPTPTTPSAVPTYGALPRLVPLTAKGTTPPNGPVILRHSGRGATVLPTFMSQGDVLYVTFSCSGPGGLDLSGLFFDSPCRGLLATTGIPGSRGKSFSVKLKADSATDWSVLIQSGSASRR